MKRDGAVNSILLVCTSAVYALILERWKHKIEPDHTSMEVAAGVAIFLLFTRARARKRQQNGETLTWQQYQTMLWRKVIISSIPIFFWQYAIRMRKRWQEVQEVWSAS
jgi:hypothetical protein